MTEPYSQFVIPDEEFATLGMWGPTGHFVCDLETFSTETNAVVFAIALVPIYRRSVKASGLSCYKVPKPDKCFYNTISVLDQLKTRDISKDTMSWWDDVTDPVAKQAFIDSFTIRGIAAGHVLYDARKYMGLHSHTTASVWGRGPAFDNAILRNLYNERDIKPGWSFRDDRCVRTAMVLPERIIHRHKNEHPHHALYDAHAEACDLVGVNHQLPDGIDLFR